MTLPLTLLPGVFEKINLPLLSAECVDPYQQLKRSRSNIELKKDESGPPDKKEPEESVIEESCNTCVNNT